MRRRSRPTFSPVSAVLLLASVLPGVAAFVGLALALEYEDDPIGSSAHAWLFHGGVALPALAAGHLWKRSALWAGVPCLLWAAAWGTDAVRSFSYLPLGWALQKVAAPWLPLAALAVGRRSSPPKVPAGHCVRCGYGLRARPGRCPECGTATRRRDTIARGRTSTE
jgi:hypothetical protein